MACIAEIVNSVFPDKDDDGYTVIMMHSAQLGLGAQAEVGKIVPDKFYNCRGKSQTDKNVNCTQQHVEALI